jgi:uncharacterized protein (DUF342 family)
VSVEKDYRIDYNLLQGGLTAEIRIVPIAPEAGVNTLNVEDILLSMKEEGIVIGILTEEIEKIVRDKILNTWVVVARGDEPKQGRDGSVRFRFNKDTKMELKEDASGKVNLRELNIIQNVKKGDILCELIPPVTGKNGITVKGEVVPGREGNPATLPPGQNVSLSGDHTTLLAAIDGMVIWKDESVIVNHEYVVDAVDGNVGNIHFNGSVVVNGEVGDGYEIHAKENITIAMSVGRVILEAGGNIIINGGILGQDFAKITAGGNLKCRFIQDSNVKVDGGIIVEDYIRNSMVSAVGPVAVRNQKGWIDTSAVSSERWIYCPTIGYETSAVETNLSIGHSPVLHKEREGILSDIVERINDFLKLQSSLAKLRALKQTSELNHQQETLYTKILDTIDKLRTTLGVYEAQISELTEKIEKTYAGNIYIEGVINEHTNIHIGMSTRKITSPMNRVHFFLNGGDIVDAEFMLAPEVKQFLESD